MIPIDRRRFLELGTAATAASLTGCFGFGNSDHPSYSDWIPASSDRIFTAYIDFSITEESAEADQLLPVILPSRDDTEITEFVPEFSGLDAIDDPLLSWPLEVGGQLIAVGSLGLAASGLGYLIDPRQPTSGVQELFVANHVVVGTGDIDVGNAEETLRSGTEGILGEIKFEEAGEIGEFTLYESTTDEMGGVTAISESAVLVADTRDEIRTVIDTHRGNHDRAAEETEPFEWLLDTAGRGHIVAGWKGPVDLDGIYLGDPTERPANDLVAPDDDVLSSVTFSAEDSEITTEFALQQSDLDSTTEDRLESQFGTSSDGTTFSADGDRVTMSGTYSGDVLDIEFTESETATPRSGSDDAADESGDLPAEVANAVSADAFELTYEAEQDRVKVEFVESIDADEVTIRAVESEYEVSTTTTRAATYFYAYIDSDGDEVVVTVTVDGVSGEVVRRKFP